MIIIVMFVLAQSMQKQKGEKQVTNSLLLLNACCTKFYIHAYVFILLFFYRFDRLAEKFPNVPVSKNNALSLFVWIHFLP